MSRRFKKKYKKLPNEVGGRDTALPEEVSEQMRGAAMSAEKNWQFELEEYIKQGEKRIMESLQKKYYIRRVGGKRYGKWEIIDLNN